MVEDEEGSVPSVSEAWEGSTSAGCLGSLNWSFGESFFSSWCLLTQNMEDTIWVASCWESIVGHRQF